MAQAPPPAIGSMVLATLGSPPAEVNVCPGTESKRTSPGCWATQFGVMNGPADGAPQASVSASTLPVASGVTDLTPFT